MPKFVYTAKDENAHLLTGVIEAAESSFVIRELKKKNLTVISVNAEKEKRTALLTGREKVRPMELVIFSQQLATLIDSGVSLVAGLIILQQQVENPYLKKIFSDIKSDIEAGNSLSSSFAKFPAVFPDIFINMIRAGETSGSLDEILERVAEYLERTENIRRKVKSALAYPVLVIGMAILIVGFLILKVVPTFKNIFTSLGGSLPLPTLILIKISDLGLRLFPFILLGVIILNIIFVKYTHTESGKLQFDRFKLRLPVFGTVIRNMAISKFVCTLATLVKSGVNILQAFEISGQVSGNKVIEQAANQIKLSMQAGENISDPMAETGKFPVLVVKMIAVGEQTGELEKMLTKISEYYEDQINETLAALTSMLEPLIIVFLGAVIGFVVLAMFLPIFKLTSTMAH